MKLGAAALAAMLGSGAFGSAAQGADPSPPNRHLRVILVGDSTMATRTGYGDALCSRFTTSVTCLNLARGGRSSESFRTEGLWDGMMAGLREGGGSSTLVLIQFGHNDQPGKPGRSTDLATEFPANLTRYVVEVRALGAWPVLITPLTRRSFHDGVLSNDLRPWADAARAVASVQRVPVIDLNAISAVAVQALGEAEADTLAEAPPGTARFDRTHLGPKGAGLFSGSVAQALLELFPTLGEVLRSTPASP